MVDLILFALDHLRGYNKKVSKGVSTGFEKVITMKPMDFEEYLWAIGLGKNVIDYVKT